LIAPTVDLSVIGLLVALRYLSVRGVPADQVKGATRLMHLSGLLTLALNIAQPIITGHYGRAAVDAVAPLLLLGWGAVGPQLLRHFHAVTHVAAPALPVEGPSAVPATDEVPAPVQEPAGEAAPPPAPVPASPAPLGKPKAPVADVPDALMDAARSIATTYQAEHGQPITPAQLRTRLGVAAPLADAVHASLTPA
jgi:hypothetical protein